MEKKYKLKIIRKCRFQGEHQVPGNIIEVDEEDRKVFLGMKTATEDLKAVIPAAPKKETAEVTKAK